MVAPRRTTACTLIPRGARTPPCPHASALLPRPNLHTSTQQMNTNRSNSMRGGSMTLNAIQYRSSQDKSLQASGGEGLLDPREGLVHGLGQPQSAAFTAAYWGAPTVWRQGVRLGRRSTTWACELAAPRTHPLRRPCGSRPTYRLRN